MVIKEIMDSILDCTSIKNSMIEMQHRISKLEQNKIKEKTKILGFSILRQKTQSKGKNGKLYVYQKWYAVKHFPSGKKICIYLGDKQDNAEEKIKRYLETKKC